MESMSVVVAGSSDVSSRGGRRCGWCSVSLLARQDRWCSKKCRQTAWRLRQLGVAEVQNDAPRRLAYADPPYPGLSKKYYSKEASYAGEVDHVSLVQKLKTYDGWALSTSRRALRDVLPLVPPETIICPWVKTHPQPDAFGPSNVHEYVLVVPGRWRRPGPPDAFVGAVARGGDSNLMGRKPIKFVSWLFSLLGAGPDDTLDDLFPGSGVVGRSWSEFCRSCREDASSSTGGQRRLGVAGRPTSPQDPEDRL